MNSRLRILYIITQGAWGGAQRYVFDLATEYALHHDVVVAIGEPKGSTNLQEKLYKINNLQIIQLHHLRRRIALYDDFLAIRELKTLYRTVQPDIIHLNSTKAGILGSLAATGYQSPHTHHAVIYTAHGWVFNEPLLPILKYSYQYLERLAANHRQGTIVLSRYDYDMGLKKLNLDPKKTVIIPLGIKPTQKILSSTAARQELSALNHNAKNTTAIKIGVIANCYKTKGLDILLKAARFIANDLHDTTISIIGSGPEAAKLIALTQKYQLQKQVEWLGSVPEAERLLKAFDLLVIPSRKEGLPYVLLEALRSGTPVVATTVGGIPEVITNQKNGLLVPPNNPHALATAIMIAIKNPTLRQEWGKEGQKLAQNNYAFTRLAEDTLIFYHSALK